MELLIALPAWAKAGLALFGLCAPVLAVMVSNYLQGRRLKTDLVNQTKTQVAVLTTKIEAERTSMSQSLQAAQALTDAKLEVADKNLQAATASLVPWEKHDKSVSHIHERLEAHAVEQRDAMQEITQSIHEIELTTTEIVGRIGRVEDIVNGST